MSELCSRDAMLGVGWIVERSWDGRRDDGIFIGSCIVSVLVLECVSISLLVIYRSRITLVARLRDSGVGLRMAKLIFCDTSTNSTACYSTTPTSTQHVTPRHSVHRTRRRVLSTCDQHFDDSNPSQRPAIRTATPNPSQRLITSECRPCSDPNRRAADDIPYNRHSPVRDINE